MSWTRAVGFGVVGFRSVRRLWPTAKVIITDTIERAQELQKRQQIAHILATQHDSTICFGKAPIQQSAAGLNHSIISFVLAVKWQAYRCIWSITAATMPQRS